MRKNVSPGRSFDLNQLSTHDASRVTWNISIQNNRLQQKSWVSKHRSSHETILQGAERERVLFVCFGGSTAKCVECHVTQNADTIFKHHEMANNRMYTALIKLLWKKPGNNQWNSYDTRYIKYHGRAASPCSCHVTGRSQSAWHTSTKSCFLCDTEDFEQTGASMGVVARAVTAVECRWGLRKGGNSL